VVRSDSSRCADDTTIFSGTYSIVTCSDSYNMHLVSLNGPQRVPVVVTDISKSYCGEQRQ